MRYVGRLKGFAFNSDEDIRRPVARKTLSRVASATTLLGFHSNFGLPCMQLVFHNPLIWYAIWEISFMIMPLFM